MFYFYFLCFILFSFFFFFPFLPTPLHSLPRSFVFHTPSHTYPMLGDIPHFIFLTFSFFSFFSSLYFSSFFFFLQLTHTCSHTPPLARHHLPLLSFFSIFFLSLHPNPLHHTTYQPIIPQSPSANRQHHVRQSTTTSHSLHLSSHHFISFLLSFLFIFILFILFCFIFLHTPLATFLPCYPKKCVSLFMHFFILF